MKYEREILYRFANTEEGKRILSYFKQLEADCADIRKISDKSAESLKGHEIASEIIREKIIKPMENIQVDKETISDYF